MQWGQLGGVLRERLGTYLAWLMANLGGLILAYVASLTVWTFHREWGNYLPPPEAFLISGVISLAVAGVSYLTFPRDKSVSLSPLLSVSWGPLLMLVYGVLIAMGVKQPVIGTIHIWRIVIVLTISCWFWSSIIWLHEHGLRLEMERPPAPPAGPPLVLQEAARELPRIDGGLTPPAQEH